MSASLHVGSPWQSTTSAKQVKLYLIEPKSPARPPHHKALFLPARTEQDKMAQLNSLFPLSQSDVDCWVPLRHHRSTHTAAACTSCSGKVYTAVLTQMCAKNLPVRPPSSGHCATSLLIPNAAHGGIHASHARPIRPSVVARLFHHL